MNGLIVVIGAIIALGAFLFALIWIIELIRRRKEDDSGFQEFLRAGAPHKHDSILRAFEGLAPEVDFTGTLSVHSVGNLNVQSGLIVACDPAFVSAEHVNPFETLVPIGQWPVTAVVLNLPEDKRVAALKVIWSDDAVEYFTPAFSKDEQNICAERRYLPAVGVDSGTAAILSVEAIEPASERIKSGDVFAHGAADPKQQNPSDLWMNVHFENGSNIIVCDSGWGDGSYASFFARNAEGKTVGYYLDFGFFDEPVRMTEFR